MGVGQGQGVHVAVSLVLVDRGHVQGQGGFAQLHWRDKTGFGMEANKESNPEEAQAESESAATPSSPESKKVKKDGGEAEDVAEDTMDGRLTQIRNLLNRNKVK